MLSDFDMTNIMAWIRNRDPTDISTQLTLPLNVPTTFSVDNAYIGIVMADGLASNLTEASTGNQKVFAIGNNYLLGTGAGDKIDFVAKEVALSEFLPPPQLGQKVIEVANSYLRLREGEGLNFIIVGANNDKLEIYHLSLGNINKPMHIDDEVMFDGSGSQFVGKALRRDFQRGLAEYTLKSRTIGDLTSYLFDLGYVATRSVGVNDEFQYGFITPEGNATLFHPNINLRQPTKEYVGKDGKISPKKLANNGQFFRQLHEKLMLRYHITHDYHRIMTALLEIQSGPSRLRLLEESEEESKKLICVKNEIDSMIAAYVRFHNKK